MGIYLIMHGAAREDTDHKLARQQKQTFKALTQLDWESMLHKVGELQQVWVKLTFPQHHDPELCSHPKSK